MNRDYTTGEWTITTDSRYNKMKEFVIGLFTELTINNNALRFGILQFFESSTNNCPTGVSNMYDDTRIETCLSGDKAGLLATAGAMTCPTIYTPLLSGLWGGRLAISGNYDGDEKCLSGTGAEAGVQTFLISMLNFVLFKPVIAISDGDSGCDTGDEVDERLLFEATGGIVISLGVGLNGASNALLENNIASDPEFFFEAEWAELNNIIYDIERITCLDVFEVQVDPICYDGATDFVFTVLGAGFVNVAWKMKCKMNALEIDAVFVDDETIECHLPWDDPMVAALYAGLGTEVFMEVDVSVSLNWGMLWSDVRTTFIYYSCSEPVYSEQECLDPSVEGCKGKTDIIFVLDTSFSVDDTEFQQLVDFTFELTERLCLDPDRQQVSVVEFTSDCYSGEAATMISLSGDQKDVVIAAKNLGRCGQGGTPLHAGLAKAKEVIDNAPRNINEAQKFVVVISDGVTDSCTAISGYTGAQLAACDTCMQGDTWKNCIPAGCCYDDMDQKLAVESTGALIFGIVVGSFPDVDSDYIQNYTASYPSLFSETSSFDQMEDIKNLLVEKTCLDVYRLRPNWGCLGENITVEVIGTGFLDANIRCLLNGTHEYFGSFDTNGDKILCDILHKPSFVDEVFYTIQVSINGGYSWSKGKDFLYYDCNVLPVQPQCMDSYVEACRGASDIVFVLDTSFSVDDNEWRSLSGFTYDVTKKLCLDPLYTWVSLVEFTTGCYDNNDVKTLATEIIPLSGNRQDIVRTTRNLGRCGAGGTPLHAGLKEAVRVFNESATRGTEAQRYVVVVSDGITDSCTGILGEDEPTRASCKTCYEGTLDYNLCPTCCVDDQKYKQQIEDNGALIFGVVVGNVTDPGVDYNYVEHNVSSYTTLFSPVNDFASILAITETLVEKTCLDVYRVKPNWDCLGNNVTLRVKGVGFLEVDIKCRLGNDNNIVDGIRLDENTINCPFIFDDLVGIVAEDFLPVQVSINKGWSWSKGKDFLFYDCTQEPELPDCLNDYLEACRGESDIIFVLDTSFSVDEEEWRLLSDFTYNITSKLCIHETYQWVSLIEFTTACEDNDENMGYSAEIVDLNGNRRNTLRAVRNLGRCGAGGTPLHAGLKKAVEVLENEAIRESDAQRYVVVVSDGITDSCVGLLGENSSLVSSCRSCYMGNGEDYTGCPDCCVDDIKYGQQLKNDHGALVFGVVVGSGSEVDPDYVKTEIASYESLFYPIDNFEKISEITEVLVERTCLDIYRLRPNNLCIGNEDPTTVSVKGTGFLDVPIRCKIGDTHVVDGVYVDKDTVECDVMFDDALFEVDEFYNLEVSINSEYSWSKGQKPLLFYDCNATDHEVLECTTGGEGCKGKSEIIFVLDTSFSVDNTEWGILRDFTYDVTYDLCVDEEYQRVSIVEFTTHCYDNNDVEGDSATIVDLTGDRTPLLRTVRNLGRCGAGATPLHSGLQTAYEILANDDLVRSDAQKYVVVVSDGITDSCVGTGGEDPEKTSCYECHIEDENDYKDCADCCHDDLKYRDLIESEGALIFGIVVGSEDEVDTEYIKHEISSYPVLYAHSQSFSEIQDIKFILIEKTCIDIYRLTPPNVCSGEDIDVIVTGTGFLNITMQCRLGEGEDAKYYDGYMIDDNKMYCSIIWDDDDPIPLETMFNLEISLTSGITWTNSQKSLLFYDCSANVTANSECLCYGQSDIVFVMDTSYSVDDTEWVTLREFSYNVSKQLCINEEFSHASVIEFTTECRDTNDEVGMASVEFHLNGDRTEILRTVRNLGRCGKGETPMHAGLELALEEIETNGRPGAYKYVVILTDGVTDSCKGLNVETKKELDKCRPAYEECQAEDYYCYKEIDECCLSDKNVVQRIKDTGAFVYSIVVGSREGGDELDQEYMRDTIASHTEFYASANSFAEISAVTQKLVLSTCVDIFFIDPAQAYVGEDVTISVYGTGFVDLGKGKLLCKIILAEEETEDAKEVLFEATYESNSKLICPVEYERLVEVYYSRRAIDQDDQGEDENEDEKFIPAGNYLLQISVGGDFWSRSQFFLYELRDNAYNWPRWLPMSAGGAALAVLCMLLLLAICLLLSLLMLANKRKPEKIQTHELQVMDLDAANPLPEPEPEPEPEAYIPTATADRSTYYLGGRAMTVDWEKDGVEYDGADADAPSPFDVDIGEKKPSLADEIARRKQQRLDRLNKIKM